MSSTALDAVEPSVQEMAAFARLERAFTPALELAAGSHAEPQWAVEKIWPEGASGIIAGRPKDGKSTLAVELAVSLWSGTPMFAQSAFPVRSRPAPVLYLQQENATRRVRNDLQAVLAARGLGAYEPDEHTGDPVFVPDDYGFYLKHPGSDGPPLFDVISQAGVNLGDLGHRAALESLVERREYKYLFLDPLYMLAPGLSDSGADTEKLKEILNWLTALPCAVIVTHHMSGKDGAVNGPESLLGSTYLWGWYEAALFTRRSAERPDFSVVADCVRDFGESFRHALLGTGVGTWWYSFEAQGASDATDRPAPRVAQSANRQALYAKNREEHPDWDKEQHAEALSVTVRTIERYAAALDGPESLSEANVAASEAE